jgi:hypothetical protein
LCGERHARRARLGGPRKARTPKTTARAHPVPPDRACRPPPPRWPSAPAGHSDASFGLFRARAGYTERFLCISLQPTLQPPRRGARGGGRQGHAVPGTRNALRQRSVAHCPRRRCLNTWTRT